jgi:hypothetical protein
MTVEQEQARYEALTEERRGYELRQKAAAKALTTARGDVVAKATAQAALDTMTTRIGLVDQELGKLGVAAMKAATPQKPGTSEAQKKPARKPARPRAKKVAG